MTTRKKIKKVHVLGLGTGYVETASWSTMLLQHKKGFKCVQDALENLRALTLIYCEGLALEQSKDRDRKRVRAEARGERFDGYELLKPECMIEEVWHDIIHGTLQDHGDIWELLQMQGWDACAAWVGPTAAKHGICWIEKSPEMIAESMSWGDEKPTDWKRNTDGTHVDPNALYYAQSHIHHIPMGVKRFRSEVK